LKPGTKFKLRELNGNVKEFLFLDAGLDGYMLKYMLVVLFLSGIWDRMFLI
jgi:hypothetical protein